MSVKKLRTSRFGFTLDPVFQVTQHASHRVVLDLLQREIGCGSVIRKHGQPETLQYFVQNRRDLLAKVIPFLEAFPLLVKRDDLRKFKEVVRALEAREHWMLAGFERLLVLIFTMNFDGKQRRYQLDELLGRIRERAGSSETIRRTPDEVPVMI